MRVSVAELADWRRRAAALSISVSELIRLRMRDGDDPAMAEVAPRRPTLGHGVAPRMVARTDRTEALHLKRRVLLSGERQ